MKGTLKNKEGKWVVEYVTHSDYVLDNNGYFNFYNGKEVEFEIVDLYKETTYDQPDKIIGKAAKLIYKQEELSNEPSKITRLEIIDHSPEGKGRVYGKHDIKSLELSYQDDGKTLKIFIK